jgi:hypothetical protein
LPSVSVARASLSSGVPASRTTRTACIELGLGLVDFPRTKPIPIAVAIAAASRTGIRRCFGLSKGI